MYNKRVWECYGHTEQNYAQIHHNSNYHLDGDKSSAPICFWAPEHRHLKLNVSQTKFLYAQTRFSSRILFSQNGTPFTQFPPSQNVRVTLEDISGDSSCINGYGTQISETNVCGGTHLRVLELKWCWHHDNGFDHSGTIRVSREEGGERSPKERQHVKGWPKKKWDEQKERRKPRELASRNQGKSVLRSGDGWLTNATERSWTETEDLVTGFAMEKSSVTLAVLHSGVEGTEVWPQWVEEKRGEEVETETINLF